MNNLPKQFIQDEYGGVSTLIVIILSLGIVVFTVASSVVLQIYIMKDMKLHEITDRALQMSEVKGELTPNIKQDTLDKLAAEGFPSTTINGMSFPNLTGSTITKVTRDSADPTVKVVITYPSNNLNLVLTLIDHNVITSQGYIKIVEYGRSEAF